MEKNQSQTPTATEIKEFSLRSFRGMEIGLGKADPMSDVSAALEKKYPGHLIVVQAGKFLHAYDRSAHALGMLKKYKVSLVGTASAPHIRAGFPAGNFRQRLWPLVQDFQIPYVVYLGNRTDGYTAYVSSHPGSNTAILLGVSDRIVHDVIADLMAHSAVNQTIAAQILTNPENSGFKLKSQAKDLDTQLLLDIIGMPRDVRTTFGENIRFCMARMMHGIFAYGTAIDKPGVLHVIDADINLLKHYLEQAARLSKLKFSAQHRVGLAVELGRLVGGLIRASKAAS